MLASSILDRKGHEVATVPPDASITRALDELARWNVGALVVSPDGVTVAGLISERDIVRRLAGDGVAVLERTVADVMEREVVTVDGRTDSRRLMALMTERRIRHVPVVEQDRLVGIVSIGDVVKTSVDELTEEATQLADYIRSGGR